MARWWVLGLLGLVFLTPGCTELLVGFADLTPASPFFTVLYSDSTRVTAADAAGPGSPAETDEPWVVETHSFQVPEPATNLTVHVGVQFTLPPDAARSDGQNVTARLEGPSGERSIASFTASGEDRWRFPAPNSGAWAVTVDGRGPSEVHVTALARGGPAILEDR